LETKYWDKRDVHKKIRLNQFLNLNGVKLVTIVYGLMSPGTKLRAYSTFPGQEKPDELPATIKNLHSYLSNLRFNKSKEWAVSVRYTFPSEPTWREAFQPTDEK